MPLDDKDHSDMLVNELNVIKFPDEEVSWNKTRAAAFRSYTDKLFNDKFSHQHKIEWKQTNGTLRMTVYTKDWGNLSVNIDLKLLNDKDKLPRNFPESLLINFERMFKAKQEKVIQNAITQRTDVVPESKIRKFPRRGKD